tara:strand:+ start:150 stop:677 length:528 start_codon:yes stop_codon:yes gene_type:complete
MRPNNQNGKRSRGRARRPSGFNQPNLNRNTTFESNGPEGKLRGNAQQLFEKYTALAQDANSSSERISAEAFSQFADHYYRVHQTILASIEQKRNTHENKSEPKQKTLDEVSLSIQNGANGDKEKEADIKNKKSEDAEPLSNNIDQDTGSADGVAESASKTEVAKAVLREEDDVVA